MSAAWFSSDACRGANEAIDAFVNAREADLIGLCGDLVAARSVNPPGRTVEAAGCVAAFLDRHRLTYDTLAKVPEKPMIVAQCEGSAPGRHLVFNGHLDTIGPGEESEWTVPLFAMTERDGRLYGIGMGNMKAAVAALTMAYVFLCDRRDLWRGTLSHTAVPDETVFGADGAAWLLDQRPDLTGDGLICGEGPGAMNLSIAEKGVLWVTLEATAPAAQGMLTQAGTSAIARLASAIGALDAMNDEQVVPPAELGALQAHAGDHGLRLSVNAGTVAGGNFVSQVATRATAEIDFRLPPGLTIADIDTRLDEITGRIPGLTSAHIKGWDANWTAPGDSLVVAIERAATAFRGKPPAPVVRLPASDGSRWRRLGVPAVCFGPQPELASGVDDYANRQDVIDCAKIYALAALAFLNG